MALADYGPDGNTPLYDAMGRTMVDLERGDSPNATENEVDVAAPMGRG